MSTKRKTILVRYYDPNEVMDVDSTTTEEEIKKTCFRVNRYKNGIEALYGYAETSACWSTLLEEGANVQEFIDKAYEKIKKNDIGWLENNFT